MKIDVLMPALSPTMEVGTLAKWLVKKGDLVKAGDLLAEIETDKAIMEFEAVEEGQILELLAKEGQTDSKGNPYRAGQKLPHPDFIRLQGQVDYKMGKISGEPGSLLNKIADAEQRRVF